MTNVLIHLKALASGIGKQDADTLYNFFEIAHQQLLKTEAEREAFRHGALAIFADVGKMPLKAAYYRYKFKRAINRLK